jgi:CRISPR system Cascade subunit CasE
MSPLYLLRAPLDTAALAQWSGDRGWVSGRGGAFAFDEGRALHHLVDELFGPGAFRPFRLLVPPRGRSGSLYAYTQSNATALREAARAHALPEHLKVLALDGLKDKPMPAQWRAGQRLGFDLRVRPVRRLRTDLETAEGRIAKGAEVDAFLLEALRRHPDSGKGMAEEERGREGVYLDWLAERLAPAATLERESSKLARFQRTRVARGESGSNGSKGLEGPDATIHGTLTIGDPAAFADLLARGVGRHRAYGYGMLLLRPPNRPVPER